MFLKFGCLAVGGPVRLQIQQQRELAASSGAPADSCLRSPTPPSWRAQVAQIAMMKEDMVIEKKWVSIPEFNKARLQAAWNISCARINVPEPPLHCSPANRSSCGGAHAHGAAGVCSLPGAAWPGSHRARLLLRPARQGTPGRPAGRPGLLPARRVCGCGVARCGSARCGSAYSRGWLAASC